MKPVFMKFTPFIRLYRRTRILVLCFGIIGFILPASYGYFNSFPVPHVHDEFSYLLAADTFAQGRLTNPTPAGWEHFETPHILVKPSYMSKYPPMQGLFLAAGQVVFGHPAFGVWLSCGAAAAAFFWMMLAWTRRRWAILGTVLMILFIGIDGYWAQSYWGGMAAATGGALFLGGFRRLFKKISISVTLLMTLGGIILVNSRPFEGTMMMIPGLFVLAVRLLRDGKSSCPQKIRRIVLPGILLTAAALSWMAYYNYRVTGSAVRFAYTEHQSQYFSTPLFFFQNPSESALEGHERLQRLYRFLNESEFYRNAEVYGLPKISHLYPLYGFVCLITNIPYFLFFPPLMVFFYVGAFLAAGKNKWMLFIFLVVLFTFACMSTATYWDNPHYAAPLICCFYLLLIEGIRCFFISAKKRSQKNLTVALLMVVLTGSFVYKYFYAEEWFFPLPKTLKSKDFSPLKLNLAEPHDLEIPKRATYLKPLIDRTADTGEKYLALVSYSNDYSIHDEIVYNRADLGNSSMIWAFDLGMEKNRNLLNFYTDRKILKVEISNSQLLIKPVNK